MAENSLVLCDTDMLYPDSGSIWNIGNQTQYA